MDENEDCNEEFRTPPSSPVKKTVAKKKGNFKNGKSFSEFMGTKTKKFGTPN